MKSLAHAWRDYRSAPRIAQDPAALHEGTWRTPGETARRGTGGLGGGARKRPWWRTWPSVVTPRTHLRFRVRRVVEVDGINLVKLSPSRFGRTSLPSQPLRARTLSRRCRCGHVDGSSPGAMPSSVSGSVTTRKRTRVESPWSSTISRFRTDALRHFIDANTRRCVDVNWFSRVKVLLEPNVDSSDAATRGGTRSERTLERLNGSG